jgi:GlcNAc-P-P-Und epimerase
MAISVIFGGTGYIGRHLARFFLIEKRFDQVYLCDIKPLDEDALPGMIYCCVDIRNKIEIDLPESPEWIFNLAAIHREPGHTASEYYVTNIKGAENVCEFAVKVSCKNIFFTSSIAVYGPTKGPTSESKFPNPITPYGGSKYPAELIHRIWLKSTPNCRLIIVRPGVVYGPGDPGNILRMINAIRRGYFVFPGSKKIKKSYAYIFGLIESVDFVMKRSEDYILYNYVETPTESIEVLALIVMKKLKIRVPVISIPAVLLMPVAQILQFLIGKKTPIHPVRIRKAGTETHIIPQTLLNMGFKFTYNFEKSLDDWLTKSKSDF